MLNKIISNNSCINSPFFIESALEAERQRSDSFSILDLSKEELGNLFFLFIRNSIDGHANEYDSECSSNQGGL